ncbi:MAG: trypsin-like peptidase domain-containing protein [Planctomycetota bacterium]
MQSKTGLLRKSMLCWKVFLLCTFIFLSSCQTTQIGISDSRSGKFKDKIVAYKIDCKEGFQIALQICNSIFDRAEIVEGGSCIRVYHEGNVWNEGTAGGYIYPTLIQSVENELETGVIFKVITFPEGWNSSLSPHFIGDKFFNELHKIAKEKNLRTVNFKKYKILKDASIVDKIAASIPTTLEDYKTFLNKKQHLHLFEGIWSSDNGDYVLGVLYDSDNPQFKYKGFIISTEKGNWKQGEIKANWYSLEDGDLCMGDWYADNKLKTTMVFKVSKKLIMSINAPKEWDSQIVLLKTYPTSQSQDIERSGTGFAISKDGLIVTAYHVIQGAKTIKVYLANDSFVSAKIIHCDPVNDLAVLKIEKFTPNFLQVALMRSVKTGDRVFTVGFPVSSVLGQEAKYTEGVVSSLSGIKGASSFLQITVPIQPGNSGGALVNERGEVVGIITSTVAILPFIEESGTLPQNVNWAVKADYLKPLFELPKIEEQHFNRDQLITHVKKATFFIESE